MTATTLAMFMLLGLGFFYYRSRQTEVSLYTKGHYDALTGLPNRQLALERLAELTRDPTKPCALFFIDIDNFKYVNDAFGHHAGDLLLVEYAKRLTTLLRQTDTVARLGGDEFLVMLPGVDHHDKAARVALKILEEFSSPIIIEQREVVASPSIGVSFFPENGKNAGELMKTADMAMYASKKAGKNHYSFYSRSQDESSARRYDIEAALRRAVDNKELFVVYQPQIATETGQVVGAEALLRWNNPALGFISPAEFIPIAEDAGLIIALGRFVMYQACLDLPLLQQRFGQDVRVAINVSAKQFRRNDIAASMQELVGSFDINPRNLEVEITESMLIDPNSGATEALQTLKDWGISIAVDDFGTGFSSLNYLRKYPVSTLKIDRSFVNEIEESPDSATLVRSIVAMGHALGLTVVAEGVETREQFEFLRSLKCDVVQGYYFYRPQSIADLCKQDSDLNTAA